jgi:outer membrane usher protein
LRHISRHPRDKVARIRARHALLLSVGGLPIAAPANAHIAALNLSLPSVSAIDPDTLLLSAWEAEANVLGANVLGANVDLPASSDAPADRPAKALPETAVSAVAIAPKINPTGREITLSAPMRDGQFVLSEVGFVLGVDDSVRVESKSFIEALRPGLAPEKLLELQAKVAGLDYVPVETLAKANYIVRYDPATIALTVKIPADVRAPRDLSLRRLDDPATGTYLQPAKLSGYINFRSFADYVWSGPDSGFQTPTSLIDSAIRFKRVVLENEATLRFGSSNQKTFTREGTRLVYDDRNRLIRFAAGDLITSGRGFSGSPQIAGLSAQRIYSIVDPLRAVQPRGDRSFTLTRPSTVEATINGQSVRRIRLDPGVYNVRDFPFVQGTNNVQFNIEDDSGGRQTIAFSQFFDRTLLAAGLTEFAVQAGIFAPFSRSARDYQFSEPAASGWLRRGIGDTLTLGGNFNARKNGVTIGAEATVATAFGILGTDIAFSKVKGVGAGYAANVGLQKSFGGYKSIARSISLSAEYRSKNFTNPGFAGVDNRISWNLSASYAQPIGKAQFVSLSGNYGIARGGFQNETSARLTYGYNISTRLNLTVDSTYENRPLLGREYGVRATLLIRLGRRSTGVTELDSRTKRVRIGYQTSRGEGVGAWTGSADLDIGKEDVGFNGGINYTANRAEIGVAHTTVYELSGQRTNSQRTSIRAGTAIVFADGKFGLSRPIFDGFALVAPHKSLKGASVVIDPREGHYTAKSGTFGPAVEPNLAAYVRRTVTYDVPNAPVGYDLGTGSAKVSPSYRGGYLIIAGSDYSVTALGTLIGTNGAPISLLAGKATEIGVSNPKTLTIFTNRTGRFGVSGMRSGKWRIEMPTEPPTVVEIEIPDKSLGVVRLGEVKLGDPK